MIEITLKRKLNSKKMFSLMNFIANKSKEVCFSAFHYYHIYEERCVEMIDEYKAKCKEKHHKLHQWYLKQEPFLLKSLAKIHIKTEEDFIEYNNNIFQNEIMLSNKMEQVLEKLQESKEQRDYKEVFPSIANGYKDVEVHLFDVVTTSIIPIDTIIYDVNDEIKQILLEYKTFKEPIIHNKEKQIYFFNPVFFDESSDYAAFATESGIGTIVVSDEEYKEFKKLKIPHKKEIIQDDEEEE